MSKFDPLSFTFNFVLSKLSILSGVFVLNLLRKRQHLIELKFLDSPRSSTCHGTSGMKYFWESFFCQMNHYLNDLGHIIPRINEDLFGSKRKRGDPV